MTFQKWYDDMCGRYSASYSGYEDLLEEAFNAGALAEREACAKVADGELMNTNMLTSYPPKSSAAWNIAAAIRARGN